MGAALHDLAGRHRRRWVWWAAFLLAGLVVLSGLSQLRHRGTAHSTAVPLVVARHPLRPGEMLRETDVEVVTGDAASAVRETGPAKGARFARAEDAVGRIALRGLRRGEVVTPGNAVPLLHYYGVSARVPPGMRAVNLVVPSAATFGGELTPQSRVDLLGAFAVGQDRAVATLLGSGIVLRVLADRGNQSTGLARPTAVNVPESAGQEGTRVEVEVAVPEVREREVILAQAFGRIFLTVHPAAAEAPHPAASGPLHLRRYLELPPEPRFSLPPVQTRLPQLPAASPAAGVRAESPYPPSAPQTGRSGVGKDVPGAALWTVEVIGGSGRSIETVPRARDSGGLGENDDTFHSPHRGER